MSDPKNGKGGFLEFAKHEKAPTNGVTPLGAVPSSTDVKPETSPVKPTASLRLDTRKPKQQ